MKTIAIPDGLSHTGIGLLFLFVFLWFFLYLIYLCLRDKAEKRRLAEIRKMMEEGKRKRKTSENPKTDLRKNGGETDKKEESEEPEWEKQIRTRAKDDFRLLK